MAKDRRGGGSSVRFLSSLSPNRTPDLTLAPFKMISISHMKEIRLPFLFIFFQLALTLDSACCFEPHLSCGDAFPASTSQHVDLVAALMRQRPFSSCVAFAKETWLSPKDIASAL